MKGIIHLYFFVFTLLIKDILCANILYMSISGSPSHHIWDKTLANALTEQKHNVTFLTQGNVGPSKTNFTVWKFEGVEIILNKTNPHFRLSELPATKIVDLINRRVIESCESAYKSNGFKHFLHYLNEVQPKYDLVLFDLIMGRCMYPIFKLVNYPPLIGTSPFGLMPHFKTAFGIDYNIAFNPVGYLPFSEQMTFFQRIKNMCYILYHLYVVQTYNLSENRQLALKYFGNNIDNIEDIERNVTLLLTNTDPLVNFPLPLPPNVIQVGGLHIQRKSEMTPELEKFLNESKNGVILFSMGTNIRSDQMGTEKRQIFLDTFAKLSQNVLWKYESVIEDLPKNVFIHKWLPQNDVLAHSNVKLFISHTAIHSSYETIYHGVPVIGFPVYVDQNRMANKFHSEKMGLRLEMGELTREMLENAITEVLNNPIYAENAARASKIFRDQPQNPLERAVFWVEYVLRHKQVKHLLPVSKHMPFYQLYLLDIIFSALLLLFIIYRTFKIIFQLCLGKTKVKLS